MNICYELRRKGQPFLPLLEMPQVYNRSKIFKITTAETFPALYRISIISEHCRALMSIKVFFWAELVQLQKLFIGLEINLKS